jgi:dihydrofolate reductase
MRRIMPKIVFSRTLERADWNTAVRHEVDPPGEIRALQREPGGDMVMGGADLADTFRRLDLIDEYRLYVNPVLLGGGRRFFGPAEAPGDLRLVEARTFGNGVVLLRHERLRSG